MTRLLLRLPRVSEGERKKPSLLSGSDNDKDSESSSSSDDFDDADETVKASDSREDLAKGEQEDTQMKGTEDKVEGEQPTSVDEISAAGCVIKAADAPIEGEQQIPKVQSEPSTTSEVGCVFKTNEEVVIQEELIRDPSKGKRALSPEEEAAEAKRAKAEKARSEALRNERLKLQAPKDVIPELGLTPAETEQALAAQRQFEAAKKAQDANQAFGEQLAKEEADRAKLADPLSAQKAELEEAERKKKEDDQFKDSRVKWYYESIHGRYLSSGITNVRLKGPPKITYDPEMILLEVGRANGIVRVEKLSWMHAYGLGEWAEVIKLVKKSKSRYKDIVLNHLYHLIKKLTKLKNHYSLGDSPLLADVQQISTRSVSLPPPMSRTPQMTPADKPGSVFQKLAKAGKTPDLSTLNLTVPTLAAHSAGTILNTPEHGIFFEDANNNLRFFRSSEIPIADSRFLQAMLSVTLYDQEGLAFYKSMTDELKKRPDAELPFIPFKVKTEEEEFGN